MACNFPLFSSFLVSVIYSKAKLASACGGIIYFLSYVPYMYVAIREEVAHDKITAFEKCIAVRRFLLFAHLFHLNLTASGVCL